ncbi:DoxX family protein [Aquibium sp. LZ166]|uniref:DoxX family protein n=1 Tax=Aquibium pacificus TaxID=3153579 RepID=A0ABV3SG39_9HYPH
MLRDPGLLIARLLLGSLFVLAAISKLSNVDGTAAYFASLGMPLPMLVTWGSAGFELLAGLAVLVGFQTAIASLLLALFSAVAGYLGHYGQGGGDPMMTLMHDQAFAKDLAMAGGFVALAIAGPGAWSVDGRRSGRETSPEHRGGGHPLKLG